MLNKKMPCGAKINLTLRVTNRLSNGFHELCSIFFKISPIDYLTIYPTREDNVKVIFGRAKSAPLGKNILLKALEKLRAGGENIQPLAMTLEKNVPPGTGLGCGSGDAAALLKALESQGFNVGRFAAQIGADVPFLLNDSRLALVGGIGDKLRPLNEVLPELDAAVVIPTWRCATPEMFSRLDEHFCGKWPFDAQAAQAESREILQRLVRGEKYGLLPNDFCAVLLNKFDGYKTIFDSFQKNGALAWGISGSGSSAFALWRRGKRPQISLDAINIMNVVAEDLFLF